MMEYRLPTLRDNDPIPDLQSYTMGDLRELIASASQNRGFISKTQIRPGSYPDNSIAYEKLQDGIPTSKIDMLGVVLPYAGSAVPTDWSDWLLCDGSAISRTTYADLFALLSTTYGSGDGSTTFNIPDLRGRVPVALDNMGGSDAGRLAATNTLGGTGGTETHTLTTSEIPSHSHTYPSQNNVAAGGSFTAVTTNAGTPVASSTAGTGGAHNNMQPYIFLNYIIKVL